MWFVGQKDSSDQFSDESEDKAENRSSDSEKRPLKKRRKSKGRNLTLDDSDNDEGAKAAGIPEPLNKIRKSKSTNSISDDSDDDEGAKAACAPEPQKKRQSAHSLLTANSINKVLEEELCSLCLNPLKYVQSTKTTSQLIVSLTPCQHQFHRYCIERVAPVSKKGVSQCLMCPICKGKSHIDIMNHVLVKALWDTGNVPPCFCGEIHNFMMEYDSCQQRPAQCNICFEIVPFSTLVKNSDGECTHDSDCCPKEGDVCLNDGCGMIIHPGDKGAHASCCVHRPISCNTCREIMPYGHFELHCRNACKNRKKTCQFCTELGKLRKYVVIPKHSSDSECAIYTLLQEAVSSPTEMLKAITVAERESMATQNFSEIPIAKAPSAERKRKRNDARVNMADDDEYGSS